MRPFWENIPPSEREEYLEALCWKYPVWFLETLVELEDKNLVLDPFQIAYLNDDSRRKIVNKTRQAGGSLIVAAEKFVYAFLNTHYRCDIASVNLKEARGKIKYIKDFYDTLPEAWKRRAPLTTDNALSIAFHEGPKRSEINSLAASAGIRGGKKDIFLDEAGHIEGLNDIYVGALPATIRGGGRIVMVSTPLGRQGKFFEIFTNQKDSKGNPMYEGWSRHEFFWFDVSAFCKDIVAARDAWINKYEQNYNYMQELVAEFATNDLLEIAAELTEEEFNQEFACEFVDESDVFFTWDLIESCVRNDEPQFEGDTNFLLPWVIRPEDAFDSDVYVGIDFAEGRKGGDETSIQVIERPANSDDVLLRASFDLSYERGFNNFGGQLEFITNEVINKFRPTVVRIDETGLGRKLSEDLRQEHGSLIEPVNFNVQSKTDMALGLKSLMEHKRLVLPRENKRLRGQIHGIKREITSSGNTRYSGEPHDDMFWALALACKGLRRAKFRVMTI